MEKQYVACRQVFCDFAVQGEYFQIVIAIGARCGDSWAAFCVFLGSFGAFGIDASLRDGDGDPEIRGFAGVRGSIVAEVPSVIMLHRNIDQHVCKANREANHTILIFLEINGNTEQHHTIRDIVPGVLCLRAAAFAMCPFPYRAGNRSNRDGDVFRTLGSCSR